jgi:2-polyprenyl-3-methyl-5-hydroxy-6-metoxy-1,4-benzoquinol methylase
LCILRPSRMERAMQSGNRPSLLGRYRWAYSVLPNAAVIADIGGAISPLTYRLSEKGGTVVAVDINSEFLSDVRTANEHIAVVQGSSLELPLKSQSVDVALFLDVLEHVTDERAAIAELARVVRLGGRLILSVPHKGLFRFLDPQNLRLRLDGSLTPETEHRHYNLSEMSKLLGADFVVRRVHRGGLFLYPLMFALDNSVKKRLQRDWSPMFRRVADWDFRCPWGGWSYNLILIAEKVVR